MVSKAVLPATVCPVCPGTWSWMAYKRASTPSSDRSVNIDFRFINDAAGKPLGKLPGKRFQLFCIFVLSSGQLPQVLRGILRVVGFIQPILSSFQHQIIVVGWAEISPAYAHGGAIKWIIHIWLLR